jgi:hypothetical protein
MEFCSQIDRSTLELSVFSHECISFSRCSYLSSLAQIKYDNLKNIDILSYDYVDNFRKKSSELCTVPCKNLSSKIENVKVGISKACNYNCYHCFNRRHADTSRDKEIYFYILNNIKGHSLNSLILGHQGEVFLYYEEIKNYLSELSFTDFKQVIFQTNLSLLNTFRIDELKKISDKTGVNYVFLPSLNGITPETHKAVTGQDDYYQVEGNLRYLLNQFGPQNIKVTFVIKEPNMSDLPNVDSYLKNFGVKYLNISYDMFDTKCKDLYLNFLNKGYLKCIYETASLDETVKSNVLKKYPKIKLNGSPITAYELWKSQNKDESLLQKAEENIKKNIEKIQIRDDYDDLLTIGITIHKEQQLSNSLVKTLLESKRIKFLISNDGGKNFNKDLKSLLSNKKNVEFIYAEPGIENNRQNILSHTNSKYVYIIDYDDELKLNESKLLDILDHTKDEVIMVNPYENGSIPDYIYHSDTQFFVTTWAQIFSTDFIRQVGGYIQTWNFYHEEFGTNANILANIYSRNIQYDVSYIQDDKILYYNHLLNEDAHNSLLKMDISKIISFIREVPKNDRIFFKKLFLSIFKERISLMNLPEKDYTKVISTIDKVRDKV